MATQILAKKDVPQSMLAIMNEKRRAGSHFEQVVVTIANHDKKQMINVRIAPKK
jgi:hypothetical protein